MKLLLLSGFLGSGKTTLLLEIAKKLVSVINNIVIIENEIGEIGIDNNYLNKEGLNVQELFGGCACCTLSVDLISTLEKVYHLYQPKLVILEATGTARPGDIIANIDKYCPVVKEIKVLTIVDVIRFKVILEVMEPLVTAQIQAADIIAINKIDKADKAEIKHVTKNVSELTEQTNIFPISAENKTNFELLLKELI